MEFVTSSEIESAKNDETQTILKLRKDGQLDGRFSIARYCKEFQGELWEQDFVKSWNQKKN